MKENNELMEKAKEAKSAEELMSLAKENGVELTAEEAASYFAQLNKSGELSDEELDNVAGGGCQARGLVHINNDLKVGDVFKYYRPEEGGFYQCYKCGNETYRVTGLRDNFQNTIDCACTRCGWKRIFNNYTDQDVFHKILM